MHFFAMHDRMICMIIHPVHASESWQMEISVSGMKINGQFKGSVTIGCSMDKKQITAPQAPLYSCAIRIIALPDWHRSLSVDIQNKQQGAYVQCRGSEFHTRNARFRQLQEQRRAKAQR